MSTDIIVLLVTGAFLVMLALEMPVALALAGSGGLGILLLGNWTQANAAMAGTPYSSIAAYSLAIIPLYVLLGMFAVHGRLAERVYAVGAVALRSLPGGLGIATVAACAGFSAVSGSSVATAATVGRISIEEMRRNGYPAAFATGIVAMGGTLGILIPPSVAMVLYGIMTGESISQLLVAGIIPGVMSAVAYAVFASLRARKLVQKPELSLEEALADAHGDAAPRSRLPKGSFRAVLWLAAIFTAIMVGMFTGIFTVIESSAIGALIALLMLFFENFRSGIKAIWKLIVMSARETAATSTMTMILMVGATVFSTFLVLSRIPFKMSEFVADLDMPPMVIIILILLILIPLGMFLDELSVMIIVVPLVHPIVTDLGFSGVWFAVLFVILLQIGLVAPPVGMNCFVISSVAKVPLATVYRGVIPFMIPAFVVVVLIMVFPDIALWLPSLTVE
ncbi:TRAP transporter large permease [Microbacterium sp. No. 7]|uniref:TRAP transporter large permease n=1 Tax=Microbacterium sp. No. 7 TaxID=1714373 RepID=UPI0006D29391|nr:TRAP transporter large permease [Microbacterium sp. No. 7]ALJ18399.1 hypothetical protein AOA12_00065 [Microbacterium sp. No. 7]